MTSLIIEITKVVLAWSFTEKFEGRVRLIMPHVRTVNTLGLRAWDKSWRSPHNEEGTIKAL